MKRIVVATGTTLSGLVLLLSYGTSIAHLANAATASTSTAGSATSSAPAATGTTTSATATYDGAAASTQFGDVQVRVTVTAGKVTAAEAISYPNSNGHDQQINSYAIPVLNKEAAAAGSANISMVSGATYTSGGYVKSLQSALDQAGL
ncbi:FMN-binding protein [Pengzhenrongella phosphoraccumulans]|uniref:FMN-binding protein n=1 Tax=Pengzhenrongella phosphoraccumulans TaxID=3114394 RepID=UPI0038907B37